ncbi:MAG: tRNA (cytidine(34)-2'-O)-methyltransferase [Pseudobdellovibrionaceae bacterium]|nr:MAG: tRNA (cytidine(34)-2'-O)-methyltransferase [Pseudobdellovibrionaceae bacterium]
MFNVVLVEPEIPSNTGNVGRTCVGTWSKLHLVGPLGFEISDKRLKRAGLDYWPHLEWQQYENFEDWWRQIVDPSRVFFFSTKGKKTLYETRFQPGDTFVFGKETKGLSEDLLARYPEQVLTIPVLGQIRSYNLSNAVAMTLSEGVRQVEFL